MANLSTPLGQRGTAAWQTPDDDRSALRLLQGFAHGDVLARALQDGERGGVPALDALMAGGEIAAERIVVHLASRLGVRVLDVLDTSGEQLNADAASAAFKTGILRLPNGTFIVAARALAVVRLAELLQRAPEAATRVQLATPGAFAAAVAEAAGSDLVARAQDGPARIDPHMSARSPLLAWIGGGVALVAGAAALVTAITAPLVSHTAFAVMFLGLAVLRLLPARGSVAEAVRARMPDHVLPIYTLLVPLYRERRCLAELCEVLAALDYPSAKLDIKFLIEADDEETRTAFERVQMPGHWEVLTVPAGWPRTKPRALNLGLAAARGAFLAIFDAEDRPEPGQLREALHAFAAGGPKLACVQARLVIDNRADNWLTRMFALEYAGLFDALLPALARHGLMFPLGGTSNHFRTAMLDLAGGWDAWNVTEDADLGVRLARRGYRSGVIASITLEEAPNRAGAWLRQRTRWLKGYVLTWAVHMRHPLRLLRDLGLRDFLVFQAFVGGVPFSALMLPIFMIGVLGHILSGVWLSTEHGPIGVVRTLFDILNLVVGFGSAIALAVIGADKRGLRGTRRYLPTVPLYWLMSSVAAWRAVVQLFGRPHVWEKTEHGLARTSAFARFKAPASARLRFPRASGSC